MLCSINKIIRLSRLLCCIPLRRDIVHGEKLTYYCTTVLTTAQSEPSLCFKIRDSRLTTGAVLAFGAELHSSISAPSAALEAPCSGSGWSWHCWTISMRAVPGKVSQWAYTKHSGEDRAFSP